jgi:hypothetical protein
MSDFKRAPIGLGLVLVLGATLSCDSDTNTGSMWSGTYSVPDEFGGGSGTVNFVVEANDTIFCFTFSGTQSGYSTACDNPATDSFPVNNNQFSIPLTTSQGTFTLKGRFKSSTQATGDILGPSSSDAVPVLNWTATGVPTSGNSGV